MRTNARPIIKFNGQKYLSIAQCAKVLDKDHYTVNAYARAGQIERQIINGVGYVEENELKRFKSEGPKKGFTKLLNPVKRVKKWDEKKIINFGSSCIVEVPTQQPLFPLETTNEEKHDRVMAALVVAASDIIAKCKRSMRVGMSRAAEMKKWPNDIEAAIAEFNIFVEEQRQLEEKEWQKMSKMI